MLIRRNALFTSAGSGVGSLLIKIGRRPIWRQRRLALPVETAEPPPGDVVRSGEPTGKATRTDSESCPSAHRSDGHESYQGSTEPSTI
jgi:hypothetical protein